MLIPPVFALASRLVVITVLAVNNVVNLFHVLPLHTIKLLVFPCPTLSACVSSRLSTIALLNAAAALFWMRPA